MSFSSISFISLFTLFLHSRKRRLKNNLSKNFFFISEASFGCSWRWRRKLSIHLSYSIHCVYLFLPQDENRKLNFYFYYMVYSFSILYFFSLSFLEILQHGIKAEEREWWKKQSPSLSLTTLNRNNWHQFVCWWIRTQGGGGVWQIKFCEEEKFPFFHFNFRHFFSFSLSHKINQIDVMMGELNCVCVCVNWG